MWDKGNNYSLEFPEVTRELETALHIGLENYGSGMASFEECRILRLNVGDKIAQLWKLYISQVCGDHSDHLINVAWNNYTPEQKHYLETKLGDYLEYRLEYIKGII